MSPRGWMLAVVCALAVTAAGADGAADGPVVVRAPGPLQWISCPARSVCFAFGPSSSRRPALYRGRAPFDGTWRRVSTPPFAGYLSCPTASMCVVLGYFHADATGPPRVAVARRLGRRGARWRTARLPSHGRRYGDTGIQCPSPRLCVAATDDRAGVPAIWRSTAPAAGRWRYETLRGLGRHGGAHDAEVSCPSVRLCVVVDGPRVASTTDPAGRHPRGRFVRLRGDGALAAPACPTSTLCLAARWHGQRASQVVVSTDPNGPASAWRGYRIPRGRLEVGQPIACASARRCVLAGWKDGKVALWATRRPARGPSGWRRTSLAGVPGAGRAPSAPSYAACAPRGACLLTWSTLSPPAVLRLGR